MDEEKLIERLEEQIENMEGMQRHCNVRFDDAIDKLKKLRHDLKYGEQPA